MRDSLWNTFWILSRKIDIFDISELLIKLFELLVCLKLYLFLTSIFFFFDSSAKFWKLLDGIYFCQQQFCQLCLFLSYKILNKTNHNQKLAFLWEYFFIFNIKISFLTEFYNELTGINSHVVGMAVERPYLFSLL